MKHDLLIYYLASNKVFAIVLNQCIHSVTDGLEEMYTGMAAYLWTQTWKLLIWKYAYLHIVAIYSKFCLFFSVTLFSFHGLSIETDPLREHFLPPLNVCLSVMISGKESIWRPVTSDVPHRSILGPVLFKIFINDLGDEAECSLRKFAVNTKPGGMTDAIDGQAHI